MHCRTQPTPTHHVPTPSILSDHQPHQQVCKVVAGQRIPNQFVPQVAADIVDLAAIPPANRFNRIYKQVGRGVLCMCACVCVSAPHPTPS